jgi:hypothetical protein
LELTNNKIRLSIRIGLLEARWDFDGSYIGVAPTDRSGSPKLLLCSAKVTVTFWNSQGTKFVLVLTKCNLGMGFSVLIDGRILSTICNGKEAVAQVKKPSR